MNNTIVITSVFPVTPAVRKWTALSQWKVIVVADQKTPPDWNCHPAVFFSVTAQKTAEFKIASRLPWNHYARKLMGYLIAIQQGADIILDTDDDNMPKTGWSIPNFNGNYRMTLPNMGFMNVYSYFTDQHIWPRGFPLKRVCDPSARICDDSLQKTPVRIGIWQGLADGEPDVDAIYRMTVKTPCRFDFKDPLVLNTGTVSPFNSQNTAFIRPLFPLLYLPASVSFRSTDIVRGLVAQPILWSAGYLLGFTSASVVQNRNAHDCLSDFESEIFCYLHAENILDVVSGVVSSRNSVETNLVNAYEGLIRHALVPESEMDLLLAWIADLQNMAATPS